MSKSKEQAVEIANSTPNPLAVEAKYRSGGGAHTTAPNHSGRRRRERMELGRLEGPVENIEDIY